MRARRDQRQFGKPKPREQSRYIHDFQPGELVKLARTVGSWSGGTGVFVVSIGRAQLFVRTIGSDPFEVHHSDLVRPRRRESKAPRSLLVSA